jgi:two-component system nitrogen regulation sensor histidine kinase NtrY
MVFSRFLWIILAHIAAIVLTSVGLGIYLQKPDFPYTVSVLIVLLTSESVSLFYYLVRIRRDLMKVITALRYEDPTMQFSTQKIDPYFGEIHRSFNDIIKNFKLIRLDKEAEQQFFRATADHIQFGIVAFSKDGTVEMANRSFLELFQISSLENLNSLAEISLELTDFLKDLKHQKEAFKKFYFHNSHHHLIFLASELTISDKNITLVSLRDISKEIDRNELESWHKLIRILKHEILNSISPIKLLSGNLMNTLKESGEETDFRKLSDEENENLLTGLQTIHRRAIGITNFVDAYSNLYQVPVLNMEQIDVGELIHRTQSLFKDQFVEEKIGFIVEIEEGLSRVKLDGKLIEQVLINLLKNGLQALGEKESKRIELTARQKDGKLSLSVKDNGIGILPEQIESIFLPFYSTKEEGNGIGLSFAQHVMRLHNGYLSVTSKPGEGSEFILRFT